MFSVIGQPDPLLLAPQDDSRISPEVMRNTNNKIFFILCGFIEFTSKVALQIYRSFCSEYLY
jgi:hypothetical protein